MSRLPNQLTGRPLARAFKILVATTAFGIAASALTGDQASTPVRSTHKHLNVRQWLQVGQASWYGLKFQGHKTATGEPFDTNGLTCAHRSLPLGSWIRVTNLHNRKSIFVRVNDRGPMIDDRIVDLSYAAAHAVGLKGVGQVKLETVSASDPEMAKALVAQLTSSTLQPPTFFPGSL